MSENVYFSMIGRSFWVLVVVAAAALVLGLGRDEARPYKNALRELDTLALYHASVDEVEKFIETETSEDIGRPILDEIVAAAQRANLAVDRVRLRDSFHYALTEVGPAFVSFRTGSVADVIALAEQVTSDGGYRVSVPHFPSPAFSKALESLFTGMLKGRFDEWTVVGTTLVGAEFSCNQADNKCKGDFAFAPALAGQELHRGSIVVDRAVKDAGLKLYHVLNFGSVTEAAEKLSTAALETIRNEINGQSIDEARAYLVKRIGEKEGSIKLFDFSFSGLAAFVAIPTILLLALLWICVQELELAGRKFNTPYEKLEVPELFYGHPFTYWLTGGTVVALPVGAICWLMRLVPAGDLLTLTGLGLAALAGLALSFVVIELRSSISNHLRLARETVTAAPAEAGV